MLYEAVDYTDENTRIIKLLERLAEDRDVPMQLIERLLLHLPIDDMTNEDLFEIYYEIRERRKSGDG